MTSVRTMAIKYATSGISVIPVNPATNKKNPKKPTIPSWKEYQQRIATRQEIDKFFSNGADVAVVCGAVSGGLEAIDFDDLEVIEPFFDCLAAKMPHINSSLVSQQTPSGGCHIIYRCETVSGNQKLARSADGADIRIETRGEGGYILIAPSRGYSLDNDLCSVTKISSEDRDKLLLVAKSFNLHNPEPVKAYKATVEDDRPGDQFNREANFEQLLIDHGWQFLRVQGDRTQWVRPDKDKKEGASATLHREQGLFVFSTNTNIPPETPISPFQFLVYSDYNGDFSAAARSLSKGKVLNGSQRFSTSLNNSSQSSTILDNSHPSLNPASTKQSDEIPIGTLINEFIEQNDGEFSVSEVDREIGIFTRREKQARSAALLYLKGKGRIKKIVGKTGRWKIIKGGLGKMSFGQKAADPLPIPLPLGLDKIAGIFPGNIVVVSGAPNAGKTAFLLRTIYGLLKTLYKEKERSKEKENKSIDFNSGNQRLKQMATNGIRYLNSEMDASELGNRLHAFPEGAEFFDNVFFAERNRDFADALVPDGINFIDFLEIHEDFFELGKRISEIHDELDGGICFIALQKKQGEQYAKGGFMSVEKPRLVLNIDRNEEFGNICKIVKCKRSLIEGKNWDGKECDFDVKGHRLVRYSAWQYVNQKQRKLINSDYARDGMEEIPDKDYAFIFRLTDGTNGRLLSKQINIWQESFPKVDVTEELRRIESDSKRKPFLGASWFHELPSMLNKKSLY